MSPIITLNERGGEDDERCPLCGGPIAAGAAPEYCDACGCLLVAWSPGARGDNDVAGVFVRALARADRPEDRRLEFLVVDRRGGRGLEGPATLAWIAAHLERARITARSLLDAVDPLLRHARRRGVGGERPG